MHGYSRGAYIHRFEPVSLIPEARKSATEGDRMESQEGMVTHKFVVTLQCSRDDELGKKVAMVMGGRERLTLGEIERALKKAGVPRVGRRASAKKWDPKKT